MAKNRDWQERRIFLGGELLDEQDAQAIVNEMRRRVRAPEILRDRGVPGARRAAVAENPRLG